MNSSDGRANHAPALGGERRQRDERLWAALLGPDGPRREEAARTIRALESERSYTQQLLEEVFHLQPWQRVAAGEGLSLLGDPRFSAPLYLSEMLAVPAGQVILGSDDYPEERPVHTVHVPGFSLAKYPVTQAAYHAFIQSSNVRVPQGWRGPKPAPTDLNKPVVFVSWHDARAYCTWLSERTGFSYRLPTEAEWMLAARGSDAPRVFPWGDSFNTLAANAWETGGIERLCAVGLFPDGAGPYGHEDLAGNVWEWTSSLFWAYPYHALDGREDPAAKAERYVMHGGSWRSRPVSLRCAARQGELPGDSFAVTGFRVARSGGTHV